MRSTLFSKVHVGIVDTPKNKFLRFFVSVEITYARNLRTKDIYLDFPKEGNAPLCSFFLIFLLLFLCRQMSRNFGLVEITLDVAACYGIFQQIQTMF